MPLLNPPLAERDPFSSIIISSTRSANSSVSAVQPLTSAASMPTPQRTEEKMVTARNCFTKYSSSVFLCSVHWPARSQSARGVFCPISNPVQPLPLSFCYCYNNNNHNHEFRNCSLIILENLWRKALTRSRLPTSTHEMLPAIRTDFPSPRSPGACFSPQRVSQGDPPSRRVGRLHSAVPVRTFVRQVLVAFEPRLHPLYQI